MHNDLGTPGNARPSGSGEVASVLDFEFAQVGFRAMDLLWVREDRPECFDGFLEGYDWAGAEALMPLLELWGSLVRVVEVTEHVYNPPAPCRCPRDEPSVVDFRQRRVRELIEEHHAVLERIA